MDLSELRVVSIQPHEEAHFQSLLDEHHYLGAAHKIGESAFYAVQWRDQWVALSVFSSCALKSRVRDEWIGWQRRESFGRLHLITCQSRFLILESVPNLASRSLALLARRVAADWPLRFGHPVVLLETFVDPGRFKGSCYVAAGWLNLGHTRGFRRKGGRYESGSSPKMMFVRPLRRDARKILSETRLAREFYLHGVYRMTLVENDCKTLLEYLSEIDDPRARRGQRYRLGSLLALSCAAVLCGARGYLQIAEWVDAQSDTVLRYFRTGLRRGKVQRPSVTCLRHAIMKADSDQLSEAFRRWWADHGPGDDAIALDGKTLRGAIDENDRQVHVLGACGHASRAPLGKKKRN